MFDILIKNGRVVDGSGNPWYSGDVGISDGRIAAVDRLDGAAAGEVIDAVGMVICPGFIDMHSHAESALLIAPELEPAVRQGVTTVVIAQDGMSYAPVAPQHRDAMRWRMSGVDDLAQTSWDWDSTAEFLSRFEGRVGVNVVSLVPLLNLYVDAVGWDYRALSPENVRRMKGLAAQVMEQGAFGLSSGLSYPPQHCVTTDNLVELCAQVAAKDGIYVTHVRYGLGDGFLDPWREAIEIGERARIPVHLSHVSIPRRHSGRAPELLEVFDDARRRGVDLTIESYCYPAGAGWLMAFMPVTFLEGGLDAAMKRLESPAARRELIRYLNFGSPAFRGGLSWDDVYITGVSLEKNRGFEGKSVGRLSDMTGKDPGTFVCDLLQEENLKVGQKFIYGVELDVRDIMQYPAHMVGSDSIFYGGSPHPRAYGTYARYLGIYSRELGLLRLEEAVRKMTSLPAQRLGVHDRGLLKRGFMADVVVFDPKTVVDKATWEAPQQFPKGIEYVIVNGKMAVRHGQHTAQLAGQVLRHQSV